MIGNRFHSAFVTSVRHCCWVFIGAGAALLIQGCASTPQHVIAPSTAGSNQAIAGARQSNRNAQRYNDLNRTTAERIEAKAIVVRKYWGK